MENIDEVNKGYDALQSHVYQRKGINLMYIEPEINIGFLWRYH